MQEYVYHWLHIASGVRGQATAHCESKAEFFWYLNRLNRSSPGRWQYWADAAGLP